MNKPLDVLLIYPNYTSKIFKSLHPPLGLANLAAVLLENNITVEILDCSFLNDLDEIKEKLSQYNPSIVGMSFMSPMKEAAYRVAEIVKDTYSDVLLVVGGPHPTVFRDECIENKNIDIVVVGEGEITFTELVKNFKKNKQEFLKNREKIKGIYFKSGNKIIKNPPREPIRDLNVFPLPAYELLPREYFGSRFSLITSRGCPFSCAYCQPTQRMIFGPGVKFDSPQRVIEKLKKILSNHQQISYIVFEDDTFTIDKKRVEEICEQIIKNGINKKVCFRCHIRARPFPDSETLEKMKKANFTNISVGFESGSDKILKELNKGTTAEDNITAGKTLRKLGFKVFAFIMIGAPSEDKNTLEETWRMVKQIKPFEARVSIVTPLPGTQLENYCRNLGILNEKIPEKERYHYDSFSEIPIKLAINKSLLLKTKKKIENFVRFNRFKTKIAENPGEIFIYLKHFVQKLV